MESPYNTFLKEHKLSLKAVHLSILEALNTDPNAEADKIFQLVRSKITTTSKQAIYNNPNMLVGLELIREIKPRSRPSLYETPTGENHE